MDLFDLTDSEGNVTARSIADTLAKRIIACSGELYDSLTLTRDGIGRLTISAQCDGSNAIILKANITDAFYDKGKVKNFCVRTENQDRDYILPGEAMGIATALFNTLTGTVIKDLAVARALTCKPPGDE